MRKSIVVSVPSDRLTKPIDPVLRGHRIGIYSSVSNRDSGEELGLLYHDVSGNKDFCYIALEDEPFLTGEARNKAYLSWFDPELAFEKEAGKLVKPFMFSEVVRFKLPMEFLVDGGYSLD